MSSSARIEELRKKFDENPRRYFAPLANEYRKAGDIDQAIAICQEHLPQQPGHMSGHIVYGQALFEAGRYDESRVVFETALALDPENLIALRHLGDIARETGDPAGARDWYRRVLDADPRNEEIAGLIATLDERPVSSSAPTPVVNPAIPFAAGASGASGAPETLSDVPTVEIPSFEAPADETPRPATAMDFLDARGENPLETVPPESPLPGLEQTARAAASSDQEELLDLTIDLPTSAPGGEVERAQDSVAADLVGYEAGRSADAAAAPPSDSLGLETMAGGSPPTGEERVGPLAGLEPTSFDDDASAATLANHPGLGLTSAFEVPAPPPAAGQGEVDVAHEPGHAEPARAEAGSEGSNDTTAGTASAPAEDAWYFPPGVEEPEAAPAAAASDLPLIDLDSEPASEETAIDESAPATTPPFATETLAELYVRQGHRDEAIAVYRQLVAQRPDDEGLRDRLAALETPSAASQGTMTIREFFGALAGRRTLAGAGENGGNGGNGGNGAHAPSPASEVSRAGNGEAGASSSLGPIDALFGGSAPRDDAAAERLAAAFGSVAGQGGGEAPASDAASAIAGAPARHATNELSLDHVFRERGSGTPAQGQPSFSFDQFFSQGAAAQDAAGARQPSPGAAPAPDDDIEQFNAWLEGLKKT